ncbi:MAG: alanine racemase [Litorilinea sp.]
MTEVGLPVTALDTPALWIDLSRMERNIAALVAEFAQGGVNWRPHTKGIKTPALAHVLLRAGAIGITCAKLGEAEVMAAAGVGDILIANQIVTDAKITRLAHLQRQADVKAVADDAGVVAKTGAIATQCGVEIGLLIEVDTGMARAGVVPGPAVVQLAQTIADTPGVRFMGLMTWEGHNLSFSDPAEKRKGIEQSIAQLGEMVDLVNAAGLETPIVSAGGSGTYQITSHLPKVTEIEAGGAIFCDQTYQSWGVELEPALFIRATATSRPTPTRLICDAGFKTAPRGFAEPLPVGFEVEKVVLSAEHGIVHLAGPSATPAIGESFDMIVGYGDATVCLHDTIYGVRDGVVEAVWEVAGRGKLR